MESNRSNSLLYFLIVVGSGVLAYTIYRASQEKQEKEAEKVPIHHSPPSPPLQLPKPKSKEEMIDRLWTNLEAWVRVVVLPRFAKLIAGVDELEAGLERLLETAILEAESFEDAMRLLDDLKKKVVEYLETGVKWPDAIEKAIKAIQRPA